MALLFFEGFEHYGTGGLPAALGGQWIVSGSYGIAVSPLPVRTGLCSLFMSHLGFLQRLLPVPGDVLIAGGAFNRDLNMLWGLGFYEGSTAHVVLNINPTTGFLIVKRGTTTLATATDHALSPASFYYVEMKGVIHDTTGSVEVRVDNDPVTFDASLTNVDTRNGGTGVADRIVFGGPTGGYAYIDDFYCCDDSGPAPANTFLGVCAVETLLPQTGNGDHTDWTPSTGSDHGAMVDDNPPDSDTTYNASSTVGHQDVYHYPATALTGTVLGVQTHLYVKKTDVGAKTVARLLRTGGTTYPGTAVSPLTSYSYFTEVSELNPDTGVAWTDADIAALQAGIKIVT